MFKRENPWANKADNEYQTKDYELSLPIVIKKNNLHSFNLIANLLKFPLIPISCWNCNVKIMRLILQKWKINSQLWEFFFCNYSNNAKNKKIKTLHNNPKIKLDQKCILTCAWQRLSILTHLTAIITLGASKHFPKQSISCISEFKLFSVEIQVRWMS